MDNFSHKTITNRITVSLRLSFIAAAGLLGAGGGVSSGSTKSSQNLGRWLTLAGYIVFAVVLVTLVFIELYFWTIRESLIPSSRKVNKPTS